MLAAGQNNSRIRLGLVTSTLMRLLAFTLFTCTIASAQWITIKTEGIPRTKDGKPNFSALAPRVNGKPDLSGMWTMAQALPCPKMLTDDQGECLEKNPIGQSTADLNKTVPGGIPYTEWSLKTMKDRQTNQLDPHVKCLPSNFPRMYTLPHITKFVETPKMLLMINEFNASYRQVFLDGRQLPVDPQPSWNGYSTAHWDGDTLVIKTNGFRDDLWMDMAGSPLTNAASVEERLRRRNFGTLEIEATVTDPKAYTKPWTFKLTDKLVVDTELIDEICLEGEDSAKHMK